MLFNQTLDAPIGYTLERYAQDKRLPVPFLLQLGMRTVKYKDVSAVGIPYWDYTKQKCGVRYRTAPAGKQKFFWANGSKPVPYLAWKTSAISDEKEIVIVEGESDAHTLHLHNFPVLAPPGAEMWKDERERPHIERFKTIYVIDEKDDGAIALKRSMSQSPLRNKIKVVRLQSVKDPSALYTAHPSDFRDRFRAALETSVPWDDKAFSDELRIHKILKKFPDRIPSGENSWITRCPAHNDQNPSLGISITEEKKILFHCFSGCTFEQITEAAKIQRRDCSSRPLGRSHSISIDSGRPSIRPTDQGNAERFVEKFGQRVRYIHPWKTWLYFDGKRWIKDQVGQVEQWAKSAIQEIYQEAMSLGQTKEATDLREWAIASESASRLSSLLSLAQSEDEIAILPENLDADQWLFNCSNGTIDLRTGAIRPHAANDLLTKLSPVAYDKEAKCPRFETFLKTIFADETGSIRRELINYIKRFLGYCLTGTVREQSVFIGLGSGANGKSTLERVAQHIFGDYSIQSEPDLLMAKRFSDHPTGQADLFSARLAICSETNEGAIVDEAKLKRLTGGDIIKARKMRQDFFEFAPTHKLMLFCNHRPQIKGTDFAIWRRIHLVPFDVQIPKEKQDKELVTKLIDEAPGILAGLVRGCLQWQNAGLNPPEDVLTATEEYRCEQDRVGKFLEECCVIGGDKRVKASDLFAAYSSWCARNGLDAGTSSGFGVRLTSKGIAKAKSGDRYRTGIALKEDDEVKMVVQGPVPF